MRRSGETTFADIRERRLVNLILASWNQIARWLRQLDNLHSTAERARRLRVRGEEDRLA